MTIFYNSIKAILNDAFTNAYWAVRFAMVQDYWQNGQLVIEDEQQCKSRADYGQIKRVYL